MKKLGYLLFTLLVVGCQNKRDVLPRQARILVGKWEQIAYEDRNSVWVDTPTDGKPSLIVRSDGVLLYGDGLAMCCPPLKLIVNFVPFKAKPTSPIPYNELCNRVDCVSCKVAEFQVNGNEMIRSECGRLIRYRRLP
ncbi:hypothetical protein [Persicitalea sp.]|uniref:hypothetical protein n=1 Tax=Persicitalea sp. TaxID=3100273 RepID=UPI0035930A4B